MTALLPDWLLVTATMLAIAVFVTGRVRLAGLLAGPALLRFVALPATLGLLHSVPGPMLIIALVAAAVLVLPVVLARAVRKLLIIFVGAEAADHAIGRALGQGIIHIFARRPK